MNIITHIESITEKNNKMEDQERIIYYELIKELPFCKIGDQAVILGNEELSINKIRMPIEYANSDFFKPVTLEEHKLIIKNNFIAFLMEKMNITEEEAELKSKTFWNVSETKPSDLIVKDFIPKN